MANFDFHRLVFGVDSDALVAQFMSYGPLKSLKVLNPEATSFYLDPAGPTQVKYIGEGFKYNNKNDPKAGIIHTIDVNAKDLPGVTFEITGLNINIATMKAAAATPETLDDILFVATIFSGDDDFFGTHYNDKFYGLAGKDTMYGSKGDDSLDGGNGSDILIGAWGTDQLTGGAGKDKFVFSKSIKGSINIDVITDFNPVDDTIRLDSAGIYDGLGPKGTLSASMFFEGDPAAHVDDGIIYDANGDLWYDVVGRGAYKFAHLDGHPTLTNEDFVIV
jgi:Ca2+-binding RTX toxin-like protein